MIPTVTESPGTKIRLRNAPAAKPPDLSESTIIVPFLFTSASSAATSANCRLSFDRDKISDFRSVVEPPNAC